MKNVIVAVIGVIVVLFVESKLPIYGDFGSYAFMSVGLALLTVVAMCSKAGSALIVLGPALATTVLIAGCYVPEGYQGWVWGTGLIMGAVLLVDGLRLVLGIGLSSKKQEPEHRPGMVTADQVMS